MKRSEFIRGIIGFLGLAVLPKGIAIKQYQRIYLLQSFVKGFRYYDGPKLLNKMREGDLLALVRDAENKHDNCAIALYFNNRKVGFLPQENNEILSRLMDASIISLQAEITHLKQKAATWENVHIAVYVLKELNEPLPQTATYLTVLDTPHYHSLKISKDRIATIYYSDTKRDDYIMNGDELYNEMIAHSKNSRIDDILHNSFGPPENMQQAVAQGKMIINKKRLPKDLSAGDLLNAIEEGMITLDDYFSEEGYVVANVNRVARLSERIENIVHVIDKFGRHFYEIKFA